MVPLRSIGPESDIININDEPSDKGGKNPNEEEEEEENAEDGADEGQSGRDTLAASSSRTEGEIGGLGESFSQVPKKKKKIVALDPDEIPDRMGKDPCPYWECFKDQEGIDLFRRTYEIPDDVIVSPVEGNRIWFSREHITVPLMAITEGGLSFPMHRILREILYHFELTPCQLSVNSYRIILLIIKLCRGEDVQPPGPPHLQELHDVSERKVFPLLPVLPKEYGEDHPRGYV